MNGAARASMYKPGGLLDLALTVHGHVTGAADCTSPILLWHYRDTLNTALHSWAKPHPTWEEFDNAVNALLEAAVNEAYAASDDGMGYLFRKCCDEPKIRYTDSTDDYFCSTCGWRS